MSIPVSIGAIARHAIDPRHVVYRGVPMRSRLEADFARHLDSLGVAWTYEPAMFTHPSGRRYLPDFRIERVGRPCYIEVKPTLDQVPTAKSRLSCVLDAIPDAVLLVVCAEGSTFFAATRDEEWLSWSERWVHQ